MFSDILNCFTNVEKDNKGKLAYTSDGLFAEYQKKEIKVTFQESCREFRVQIH